mgnify:CR=1 FL=1
MKTQQDFEIFLEKAEGLTPDETQSFLSATVPVAFPEFFLFNLPGMKKEGSNQECSFFDSSGAFTRAMIMETAGQKELESVLQAYLSFKQEAESFFRGRGSRVFQPGVETRLVLFAKTFHPEFVQYLRFYGVQASLVSYTVIQRDGKNGILLRRVRDEAEGSELGPYPLEPMGEEKRGFFFKDTELSLEEQRALERLHSLRQILTPQGSSGFEGKKEGGTDVLSI